MSTWIYSYIAWFLLPVWLMAGLADWWCHRKEHIERTSGTQESVLHLLMLAEVGVPILYCLLFTINASAIVVCLVGFVLHEITAWWDVRFAFNRRRIGPTEQHVHSFLEVLPVVALSCVVALHPDQFLALLGSSDRAPNFSIRLKSSWPFEYVAIVLGMVFLLQLIPYSEEFWRCMRAKKPDAMPYPT
jgi:hypothetical protein